MIVDLPFCLITFWDRIQPFDSWLITHINQDWGNSFFDTVLPYMRETLFWVPLYMFLLLFVTSNFGIKGWWWVMGVVLCAALSDLISSQFIKKTIWRTRPCRDEILGPQLRFFINYCPGSSSFTSSHAVNHFAQATFFFITLRPVMGRWANLFLVWAFIIAYTQVYVGVHYPFDVFCGALLGIGIGLSLSKLFHKRIGMLTVS